MAAAAARPALAASAAARASSAAKESDSGGGGGLGAGGDIFAQQGATLVIEGGTLAKGSVTPGAAGNDSEFAAGDAFGTGIFLQGDEKITLGAGQTAGQTTTVSGGIADEAGSVSGAAGVGGVIVAGLGTVALDAADTYAGGTLVDAGATLEIGAADEIGAGALTLDAGATLETIGVFAMANRISLAGLAHFDIAASDALTLSGPIGDGAQAGGLVLEGLGATHADGRRRLHRRRDHRRRREALPFGRGRPRRGRRARRRGRDARRRDRRCPRLIGDLERDRLARGRGDAGSARRKARPSKPTRCCGSRIGRFRPRRRRRSRKTWSMPASCRRTPPRTSPSTAATC